MPIAPTIYLELLLIAPVAGMLLLYPTTHPQRIWS
jgi:hypothetical protein